MSKYTTENIRNIAILGSAGAGKTSLVEVLLHDAGVIGRVGRVEDGNTVCDYEDLEKELKHSLETAIVHLDYEGAHINLIDTPGAPDFFGKAISVLPAVEMVAIVMDPAAGIDTMTRRVMKRCEERNKPRMIIVNKIDHHAQLAELLDQLQEAFGSVVRPINLTVNNGKGVIDCFNNATGQSDLGDVAKFHTAIVDQVVEVDEELMASYLEQGSVTPEQLEKPFAKALREGHLIPVCFTSVRDHVGIKELIHLFAHYAPNPLSGNQVGFYYGSGDQRKEFKPRAEDVKSTIAHVFKVSSDPFVGKLCVFRVHQGHVGPDIHPVIDDHKKAVRIAHVFNLQGKEHTESDRIIAGDIGAVAKIDDIHYNSVIHTGDIAPDLRIKSIELPKPMFGLAIEGTAKGAETKLAEALKKLVAEDPTLAWERVQTTGETVLRGLGEQHLRIKLRLLKERYGVDVQTKPPKVAYKETITAKADGHHRHKKQTGGAGQFGEVFLRVEPLNGVDAASPDVSDGLMFVDDTFGGSIPKQYLPAVEKGIRQVMTSGAIAGYPMQDIKVSVYDGKYHPVDSKEVAFITAGKRAFIDAVKKARPVLLEPFVKMEITVPADLIGDISSDLSTRRGRIMGTDMLPGNIAVVQAEAPLAELMNYSSQLKSISGGAGSFSMDYSHDERTPPNVQADVVAQFNPKVEED